MKIKPVKAWARRAWHSSIKSAYIDADCIHSTHAKALRYCEVDEVIPVLITPIERKPAKKKARKR